MPFYVQPILLCRNRRQAELPCNKIILPYPELPMTEDSGERSQRASSLLEWPGREWCANIGCPSCGRVLVYGPGAVSWAVAPYQGRGQFRSDTVCVYVESECATAGCRVPIKFHTIIEDRSPRSFDELRDKLHRGFFVATCRNGHSMLPTPRERYRLCEVLDPIPSDPSLS
jgi:hypothetical protein